VTFAHVTRGGLYYRVCDPTWANPADTSYAKRHGGRWNPPGEFGALYLNRTVDVAAANARRSLYQQFGDAVTFDDLQPSMLPYLLHVAVDEHAFVDACSDRGLEALHLPASYPTGCEHDVCQTIGRAAKDAGEAGVAARSAARPNGEELAIFDSHLHLHHPGTREPFERWYLGLA